MATNSSVISRRYPSIPLVAVAAAVFNEEGKVLLVRRGRPPSLGQWALPGGRLELGERLADGVRRELREECGIEIDVGEIVAAFEPIEYDDDGQVEYHYVVLDYWASHIRGEAIAQDDADAVAWVDVTHLLQYQMCTETVEVIKKAYEQWIQHQ
ncbi:NUDIX hydrolase [Chloroflexi bacterium TSY]|nr:NUDIX hydrolase [Chloroflexi bacterium TSY]